jgi:hypothetical protein
MFRCIAIVFSFLALLLIQAHNSIAHTHEKAKAPVVHHHHGSHSHDDDHERGNANDSHDPEFGKYLLNKQETVKFSISPSYLFLAASIPDLPKAADQEIPLYSISPHKAVPRRDILTALHFRGPPRTAML